MISNRSMPSATVIPELAYPDLDEAVAWLVTAFGFRLRLRVADHRAQLVLGDGAIVLVEHPRTGEVTPIAHSLMVRVTDVDLHHANAVEHGARILRPPVTYPYGERQYTATDPIGRTWTFSQTLADVDPSEWGGKAIDLGEG